MQKVKKTTSTKSQVKELLKKSKQPFKTVDTSRKYHGSYLAINQPNKTTTTPLLSIDWLQFWAKIKYPTQTTDINGTRITNFESQLDATTTQFELKHIEILGDPLFKKHVEFFDYSANPLRPIINISYQPKLNTPADLILIKVDNWALYYYRNNLFEFVTKIEFLLNIDFYRLGRFDVCIDFQQFANKLHPTTFIKRFLSCTYIKRFTTSYALHGKATRNLLNHYIRFGSKSQPIQWYLYNKSKELREKTDKPWIRSIWNFPLNQDIWRLEFSTKPNCLIGESLDTSGEVCGTKSYSKDLLKTENTKQYFEDLFYTHCDFRHNDGQTKKERMNRVNLFKHISFNVLTKVKPQTSSNRMDKIFISMLEQLNRAWREKNEYDISAQNLINKTLEDKDLIEWHQNKFNNQNHEREYIKPLTTIESKSDLKTNAPNLLF